MGSMGTPPIFPPEIFFTKITQNGLKWILNTTFKNVTFCRRDPPPNGTFVTNFFLKGSLIWAAVNPRLMSGGNSQLENLGFITKKTQV